MNNLEKYIISLYISGIDVDVIVDRFYTKMKHSYNKRYENLFNYISFGKVSKKECKNYTILTILDYLNKTNKF